MEARLSGSWLELGSGSDLAVRCSLVVAEVRNLAAAEVLAELEGRWAFDLALLVVL